MPKKKLAGKGDKSMPYQTFLDRVKDFKELDFLPIPLTHLPTNIDDFVQNKAMWYKSCYYYYYYSALQCYLKFGQVKLERLGKGMPWTLN